MHGSTSGSGTLPGFVRSAILLAAGILSAALLLMPIAIQRSGSGSLGGLAIAGAICFVSGMFSEISSASFARTTPLVGTFVGMTVRMVLPLVVCVALVAAGENGREHIAFIGYLLTFYIVTLALETCLAVKRASVRPSVLKKSPR